MFHVKPRDESQATIRYSRDSNPEREISMLITESVAEAEKYIKLYEIKTRERHFEYAVNGPSPSVMLDNAREIATQITDNLNADVGLMYISTSFVECLETSAMDGAQVSVGVTNCHAEVSLRVL